MILYSICITNFRKQNQLPLRDEYELLVDGKKDLSKQKLMSPSNRSIDFILNYAEKSVETLQAHI